MPRATTWMDTVMDRDVLANGVSFESLLNTGFDLTRGVTAIRTLVTLGLSSLSVAGAWGTARVYVGIGIASQEAFAASVLPDPGIESDQPARGWIMRTSVVVSQNGAGGPVTVPLNLDIRGARKIENGELFISIQHFDVSGTSFGVNTSGLVRVLLKLP